MSILIKGMDMPKPFDHLFVGETLEGDLHVRNKTEDGDDVVWYPLIEIPPHGRLIDADKILQHDHQHYEYLSDEFYITVRDIENAPTIIPADKEEING